MRTLLLLILTGCLYNSVNAQKLIKEGSCFIFEGEKYCGEKEKDQLFSQHDEAYSWYKKSVSSNDGAINLGLFSIDGLAATYFILDGVEDDGPRALSKYSSGIAVGAISIVLAAVGFNKSSNSKFQLQQAINTFNEGEPEILSSKKRFEINYGMVGSGLGFVVSF